MSLSIERVSKKYLLSHGGSGATLLRDALSSGIKALAGGLLTARVKPEQEVFWALRDIDLRVSAGERVGILGRNGAGKSTLLKVVSRITEPTSGRIRIKGRLASLLEVGTGFHPELTGRENIFLNGIILGMTRREIRRKFDDIVQFAEIERFLDTPVKRYSSGMYVRLAFAVAAHVEADILLVDEVLAVGDVRFQEKCLAQMEHATSGGRTVLFVSHNMSAISRLCTRGVVLDSGRVVHDGEVEQAIQAYMARSTAGASLSWQRPADAQAAAIELVSARATFRRAELDKLTLEFEYRSNAPHPDCYVVLDLLEAAGTTLMQAMPTIRPFIRYRSEHPVQQVRMEMEFPGLVPGNYDISIWHGPHNTDTMEWWQRILRFTITDSPVPERTFPHPREHGFMVAKSRLLD